MAIFFTAERRRLNGPQSAAKRPSAPLRRRVSAVKKELASIGLYVLLLLPVPALSAQPLQVKNLRCEMRNNPLGIDIRTPRLSWEIHDDGRGIYQTAYHVLVASSPEKLSANEGDLWDSGKVPSDQSLHVTFGGKPLEGRMQCFWKVKVWTNKSESEWSEPAFWSMGLFSNNWEARWIGLDRSFPWDSANTMFSRLSARYFRKEFVADKPVTRATAYIVGLGLYELYINGVKAGEQVLSPAPTDYTNTVFYNTFDVTKKLKQGTNAIGTVLGNGRYFAMRQAYKPYKIHTFGYPKLLFQLEIEYADGSRDKVISDNTWKVTADGPIRSDNEYDGEEYDAPKEMPGWNRAGFEDTRWLPVDMVEEPGGKVMAQMNANMKVMETIPPVSIKKLPTGQYILDMGQNMAGWVRMNVKGNRGDKVILRFAETIQKDGSLYTANLRDAKVTDVYTLKGGGTETWEPSFVYHGFRYVEITGYPGTPALNDFEGRVVYDEMETSGTFETSNATINQIYKNAYWGIRSNYKGMPIDCPQRNERQPWLGDRATGSYGESFIFNNLALYSKWLNDIEDAQTAEGRIPDVAPNFWFYYKDNMTWPGTYLMVADMLHRQYGVVKPIADHYRSMKQWLVFMEARYMDDYIVSKDSYGDWCVPPESQELIHSKDTARITDGKLIATAYYYYMLTLMQRFATLLDKPDDALAYEKLAANIRDAFNNKFFNNETGQYGNNTVTANILPLRFGMVPDGLKETVFNNIVDKIVNENKGHISTGVIGTQWLMRTLTEYGRPDIAYTITTVRDYPGWGYMVDHGATTIWELWNGDTADPSMNSHNHVMLLGDLIVWYYENLGGIQSDPEHPGFKRIIMRPEQINGLDYVSASYHSAYGKIISNWKRKGNTFSWNISVPPNTTAIVYVPSKSQNALKENGKKITDKTPVKFLRREGDRTVLEIGPGEYFFESTTN